MNSISYDLLYDLLCHPTAIRFTQLGTIMGSLTRLAGSITPLFYAENIELFFVGKTANSNSINFPLGNVLLCLNIRLRN